MVCLSKDFLLKTLLITINNGKKRFLLLVSLTVVLLCAIAIFSIIGNRLPDNIETKAKELKEYCVKNNYNTNVGVLVDYSVHSGCARFVVWDFKNNKVLLKSICAQGCGKGENQGKNVFSNEIGSLCSSLGHYKIGKKRKMNSIKGRGRQSHPQLPREVR